jgi:DNA-binding NarL/FixJ family response regulator
MKQTGKIKIAFVDSTKIYKAGLQAILKKCEKIEIIGDIKCDGSLLKFMIAKKPDILFFDASDVNAAKVAAISCVIKHYPAIKVIIFLANSNGEFFTDVIKIPAHGFVLKESEENIIEVIRRVYAGEIYYSGKLISQKENMLAHEKVCVPFFSQKEAAIIKGICNDMTSKEIAKSLFLSVRTVEGYRVKILEKINAKGTAGIVVYALQRDLFIIIIIASILIIMANGAPHSFQ